LSHELSGLNGFRVSELVSGSRLLLDDEDEEDEAVGEGACW
jgi:hypothetical protein